MTNGEAVNWLINISADIGKAEHRDLWHYEQALYEIREMLEFAQPEPQWIPCSERLPEDIEDTHPIVIICGDFGVSVGFNGEYIDGDRYWYDIRDDIERPTVQAWLPLPEPYKEDKDG